MLVRMNGRMPKAGSLAVLAHLVPKRNSIGPISIIAGRPLMMRYIVMMSTHPTVISPRMRKIKCIRSSIRRFGLAL